METEITVVMRAANFMGNWILSASYTLHMLATVLWVGGLVFQAIFLLPLLTKPSLDASSSRSISLMQTRFLPLAWLSLAVLFGTGLTQMTAHPQYEGLLAIQNRWSIAILVKHLSILPMVAITAFQSLILHPRLQRELLRSKSNPERGKHQATITAEKRLVTVNVFFSVLVLILTAIARTS
jgi:uncharacterized membrane protein